MLESTLFNTLKSELKSKSTQKDAIALLVQHAKHLTQAERCSIFIYHKEKDQLKSVYADGLKGSIALKSNIGIVGYAFHKKQTILENNTQKSRIFFKTVDTKTQYQTDTILAVPLIKDNRRVGVIELLNKKEGFTQEDKDTLEQLATMLLDILLPAQTPIIADSPKESLQNIQELFDSYLDSRRLYLMEDGSAYYKIIGMKREHFIAADQCYLLDEAEKKVDIYYYSTNGDFLAFKILVKLDPNGKHLLINESVNQNNFVAYALEKDEEVL